MGKLYFYYSAMNAGKTTTLLQSAFNYYERGMKTLLFTPKLDNRYDVGMITSRIGLQAKAIPFDDDFNFFTHAKDTISEYSCILVDEAQFLNKHQVMQLADLIDMFGVPVLAYGLRSDFRGEPFEGSQYLLAWADEISEIKTICHCGKKATFNARISAEGEVETEGNQIEIGGNTRYVSLCRKHYRLRIAYPKHMRPCISPTPTVYTSCPPSAQGSPVKHIYNSNNTNKHDDDDEFE